MSDRRVIAPCALFWTPHAGDRETRAGAFAPRILKEERKDENGGNGNAGRAELSENGG